MTPRPVEIALRKFIDHYDGGHSSYLLAVSGGIDSMALLYAFVELAKRLPIKISVAYIHHGGGSPESVHYRNQAHDYVRDVCSKLSLPFFSNIASTDDLSKVVLDNESEASFRKLRLVELKIKDETGSQYVVYAHHKDDLLETRLVRLVRGTGAQGLVAMRKKRGALLRPFLSLSRAQLDEYVHMVGASFVEDPSNTDSQYLRNWIRESWLPALDAHRPGSKAVLGRSLSLVAQEVSKKESLASCFEPDGRIIRSEWIGLTLEDKKRVFAHYLKSQNVKNYGLSHVNELVKRLDVERKELTFKLAQKIG